MRELLQLTGQWVKLKGQVLVRRVRVFMLTGSTLSHKERLRRAQATVHQRHLHVRNEEQRIESELKRASARL